MKIRSALFITLLLSALFAWGCASKWAMDTDMSEVSLLWLQEPRVPKVKHIMTIKGFKEEGTSLKSVIFGKGFWPLLRPVAVANGADGRLAIVDLEANCVSLFQPADQWYRRICSTPSGDLQSPVSAIFDETSRLYVSDSAQGRVFVFDKAGDYLFSIAESGGTALKRPTGLAYDRDKKVLYIADAVLNRIFAFTKEGTPLFSFGGRGAGNGQFNFPTHLFWSPAGLLYVTDAMNFRIQIFDSAGHFRTAFGHHGDGSGDFSMPKGVIADQFGVIYVVDSLFDNIQLFDERGDFLLTLGKRGSDYGEFWLPSGISFGGSARNWIYVCDTYNQRVQVFQSDGTGN